MMECRQIDELMMDYIYQELDEAQAAQVRSHVDECARCGSELMGMARVRAAARSLPELEPPPALSARLLHEAAKRAPRSRSERKGLVAWFASWLMPVARHPLAAAMASMVLVAGAAGYFAWHRGQSGTVTKDIQAVAEAPRQPSPEPAPPAALTAAPADEIQAEKPKPAFEPVGKTDGNTPVKKNVQKTEEVPRFGRIVEPQKQQKLRDSVSAKELFAQPPPAVPAAQEPRATSSAARADLAEKDMVSPSSQDGAGEALPAQKRMDVESAGEGAIRAPSRSRAASHVRAEEPSIAGIKPAPSAPAPMAPVPEGRGISGAGSVQGAIAPAREAEAKKEKDELQGLQGSFTRAVASGDCALMQKLASRIRTLDLVYYQKHVQRDPALGRCAKVKEEPATKTKAAPARKK
ncbi:MAG: zf-HC2 domain-containing protein [Deltaproteobacteria bacterium]|nr:zf-HC2 domain-containing protein [Deltaproteobacteria bacterium]